MIRALITGAGGMLGSAMVPAFIRAGYEVCATDIKPGWDHLDVRDDAEARAVARLRRPDLIVHMAAETDLEWCELNPEEAYRTNATGTTHMADIARTLDIPLVYIGTAGIFDGQRDGYTEADKPNPVNAYAASKLAGEEYARGPRNLIVRAGWMMGGRELDHKFVSLIRAQLDEPDIYAVTDRWGSPTYTEDFARNLLALIASGHTGTYHMTCEGSPMRYEVAEAIVEMMGSTATVHPVGSQHFAKRYPVERPECEVLVNARLREIGLNLMRPWRDALRDYLGGWT